MFFFEILNPFFRGQLDVPLPTYPYKKSLYSGSSPQESLENSINTMGTVRGTPNCPLFFVLQNDFLHIFRSKNMLSYPYRPCMVYI